MQRYILNKNEPDVKDQIIGRLNDGELVVMPTDTIYGIHASVFQPESVEKAHAIRQRPETKPFIIIISSLEDLPILGIYLTDSQKEFLNDHWPSSLSVVLPCSTTSPTYLHRGTNTLAFRMPNDPFLQEILTTSGPLISTSVNIADHPPATTINEAFNYFGNTISLYVDAGEIKSNPSTVIQFQDDSLTILRQGSVIIK